MRLMLGDDVGNPTLLVDVLQEKKVNNFDFYVVNGDWYGSYTNGNITINGCPTGDFTSLDKCTIICDNQDRLRGEYHEVFANFHDVKYNAPKPKSFSQEWDDDIPF